VRVDDEWGPRVQDAQDIPFRRGAGRISVSSRPGINTTNSPAFSPIRGALQLLE
jgi:hypothetical protein